MKIEVATPVLVPPAMLHMIDRLAAYLTQQGLPLESADDLLANAKLTAEQRAWLEDFSTDWESMQRELAGASA